MILRNPDEEVVARFTRNVDPEEVRRAAEENHKKAASCPIHPSSAWKECPLNVGFRGP